MDKSMGEIAATKAEGKVKASQKQSKMEATGKSKDVKGAYQEQIMMLNVRRFAIQKGIKKGMVVEFECLLICHL